jgi:hypothetical protein
MNDKHFGWGMTRKSYVVKHRPDGSVYWLCSDGREMEPLPPPVILSDDEVKEIWGRNEMET